MNSPAEHHEALQARLKACDVRPTPQRELVLKVILDKRDHPTADEIFARVKADLPTISLATVYNCLDTLVCCGLVRQVNFDRAPTRYCPNLHEHAHFHDESTGKVHDIDVPADVLARLRALLPAGFDASAVELSFRGSAGSPRPETAAGRGKTGTN
jgi:Fur family peroxide stress response transcriptional regulator